MRIKRGWSGGQSVRYYRPAKASVGISPKDVYKESVGMNSFLAKAKTKERQVAAKATGIISSRIFRNIPAKPPVDLSGQKESVLEEFRGTVDRVVDEVAFVTLYSSSDEELLGQYPASKLSDHGVELEGGHFYCRTVEVDGQISVTIEPIKRRTLSSFEELAIDRRIDELTASDVFDGKE